MAKIKGRPLRYGVAVLAVVLAVAFLTIPQIGKGLGSILFLAVLVSAWYGGLGPGLLATALITAVAIFNLSFLAPDLAPWRVIAVVLFVAGGVLITLLVEGLHAARRRVEASQQWLTAVLSSIGDAVIATDARGRVTFLNPVARILTGWESEEEAAGRPLSEIFRVINEDTREPVEDPVTRVLRDDMVVGLANHTILIARDGTRRPIDDSGAPIKEWDGATTGVVLVFRDVTQRQRAEAVQSRLAAIVESSDDAIFGEDLDGIVISWNAGAERLFGYAAAEMVGGPITLLVPPDRRREESEILARLRRGERVDHFETVLLARDRRWIDVSLMISPLRDSYGRIVGVSKIARDITERKHLEQELRRRVEELAETDRRKDEFVAMLAHELRNPLAVISGAVEVSDRVDAAEEIEWCKDVIKRQVKHLSRLIDDLLDVSRITQGKIRLRKERLDVAKVLCGAIESVRFLIEARRHKLTVAIAPETLPAEADPVRLEQIVTNLLTNAAKYTENGGQIWLSAHREDGAIVIKVRDTGMGIPPEQIPRMFDLFAQGDRSPARSEGGLGIGLTVARSLAEMHGGLLTAASEGPGTGSEFVVRLPAASPALADPAGPRPRGGPIGRRTSRVLIIDDNIDMVRGLASLLKRQNYEVWIAYDGPSGLEAARVHRPEVLLLDIGLPGMDGYQVAEQLRREAFGKDVVLIAATGYGQEEDRQRALSAGFDHFVIKPVDYATLQALMAPSGSAVR
jgi:PAS domain S-box-containing protein